MTSRQEDLLPQGPIRPGHTHQAADLGHRPAPDQFHEPEDRRDALLQEAQELVEELLHARGPPWPDTLPAARARVANQGGDAFSSCVCQTAPGAGSALTLMRLAEALTRLPARAFHTAFVAMADGRLSRCRGFCPGKRYCRRSRRPFRARRTRSARRTLRCAPRLPVTTCMPGAPACRAHAAKPSISSAPNPLLRNAGAILMCRCAGYRRHRSRNSRLK